MKKIAIFLLLFGAASLASCGTLQEYLPLSGITLTPQPSPLATRIQDTQTPEPTSTPTVDSNATLAVMGTQLSSAQEAERLAQLEIDNLNRKMVEATAAHEAGLLQIAFITQEVYETSVSGTQMAAVLTSTAYPTAAFLQSEMIRLEEKRIEARKAEPTHNWALADSLHAEEKIKQEIFFKWTVIAFVLVMTLWLVLHLIGVLVRASRSQVEPEEEDTEAEEAPSDPIPMVQAKDNPNQTFRAEIDCTNEQIVELADGIENQNKTLAFRQWAGTAVYKNLVHIRDFMKRKEIGFAVPLEGKGGELHITEAGHGFLQMCLVLKSPPAPYKCLD